MKMVHFACKIYDSLRQIDNYPRDIGWGNSGGFVSVVNKPNVKGAQIQTDGATHDPSYFIRKDSPDIRDNYKVNDILIVRVKHDKHILRLDTDSHPLSSSKLHQTLNIDKGSYFESYASHRVNEAGTGRQSIWVGLFQDVGIVNIWDCERLYESIDNLANPLYLSTKQGLEIDGTECYSFMKELKSISHIMDVHNSKVSISSTNLDIINEEYIISRWLYERMNSSGALLEGELVKVWAIDNDENWKEIYTGNVRSIDNNTFETKYTLQISDPLYKFKQTLFTRELSEYGIEGIGDINANRMPVGFYCIEEIPDPEEPTEKTRLIYFGEKNGFEPPMDYHIMDFFEGILQILFSPPNPDIAPYLTDDWMDYVDLESFEYIRNILGNNYDNHYFEFIESENDPFDFIRQQVFVACGVFPYINSSGKLALKIHEQPSEGAATLTLSENNILSVNNKIISSENIINNVQLMWNYDYGEEGQTPEGEERTEFKDVYYHIYIDSFEKFQELRPSDFEVKFLGLNNISPSTQSIITTYVKDYMFQRYGMPSVQIELTVPLEVLGDLHTGSYVNLIHDHIVEWNGENAGLPGLGNIVDPVDPVAYMDSNHNWAGYIHNNTLGKHDGGKWVVDTNKEEIQANYYSSTTESNGSCKQNHSFIDGWLTKQEL